MEGHIGIFVLVCSLSQWEALVDGDILAYPESLNRVSLIAVELIELILVYLVYHAELGLRLKLLRTPLDLDSIVLKHFECLSKHLHRQEQTLAFTTPTVHDSHQL